MAEARPVTREEFYAWRGHPVTKQFLIQLNEWKESRVVDVFTGKTSNEREDQLAIGEVRGAEQAMRIAAEELECLEEDLNSD